MPEIHLPPKGSVVGAETRVLLAECRTPAFSGFNLKDATKCMQMMDLVLWNRLNNKPAQFGAPGAKSLTDIIKAPGQFAGFENYPNYDPVIVRRIQSMVNIANNSKDSRNEDFFNFIKAAVDVAESPTIADPSPGILASWRTKGAGSPGSKFKEFETILGNTFFSI